VISVAAISAIGIREGLLTWHFTQLLEYQINKLEHADGTEILLLGDSSLGNSIDARAWSDALNRPVLSLALTGVYGYAGALNMLRRALRRHEVRTVVLIFSFDAMARPVEHRALVLTAERFEDFSDAPLGAVWDTVANLDISINVLGTLVVRPKSNFRDYRQNDYFPQSRSIFTGSGTAPNRKFRLTDIVAGKGYYLRRIGELCAAENLDCIYAHGPLVETQCNDSTQYKLAVNERIRNAGFDVVDTTPMCIPWTQIGDSLDHVGPEYKAAFSARFLNLLRLKLWR